PRQAPELIVCPTCGRTQIDVVALARKVKKALAGASGPARVAVMGCIVNGPGEAADADVAICAAKGKAFIYRRGEKVATVPEKDIAAAILAEIARL
ncbi:MAG TPA: flavodoxin-dependent (E)-4-hydroxy-3-methylbut-2-enyl-diphosphate synthase, partial [Sedimentisphaerales bacterium]|nr:flavodoxin-dependent (E)-4-hydroxy-3-methylbut-2-enyl-diphosphate synthase [Sedimentisphaerales bacterium]